MENQKFNSNNIEYIIAPKGTILYRVNRDIISNDLVKEAYKCDDTGKIGLYFSNGEYIPLGMILEYNTPMYMSRYILEEDIKFYVGKYSFRILEGERFYKTVDDMKNDRFIFDVDPIQSYNHIDNDLFPCIDVFDNVFQGKESEYFIGVDSLKHVKCIDNSKLEKIDVDVAYYRLIKRQEKLINNAK